MQQIINSLGLDQPFQIVGNDHLDSCFAVTDLAASSIAAVGSALLGLMNDSGMCSSAPSIQVDKRLASLWFAWSIQPVAWDMPPIWDAVAGDYQTRDGWIKLHTNLAHHRAAALGVLEVEAVRASVAKAVLSWKSDDLESEVVQAGGVAAALRTRQEWQTHPQGKAVASEPLIAWGETRPGRSRFSTDSPSRPLDGLRVLDLTRVLAGPVATRTLAGFGAEVLRIDPPEWQEANVVPDITLGKRCARLDLKLAVDRKIFEALLADADVLVHGYRPGALHDLGYGESARQALSENLIEVCLDAYGWTGPWAQRRGFDSLVQMSSGIADTGMHWAEQEKAKQQKPKSLPVQALDHATGYLMAAAVIQLLRNALKGAGVGSARLSLARTAELLTAYPQAIRTNFDGKPELADFSSEVELTPWGKARRLRSALEIQGTPMRWDLAASDLGTNPPEWLAIK